jgi:hypothetical protein
MLAVVMRAEPVPFGTRSEGLLRRNILWGHDGKMGLSPFTAKENPMPFTYVGDLRALDRLKLFGKGECVDIIKALVPGLIGVSTTLWKEGAMVKDSPGLKRGTAIATFTKGRLPHANTGQHAAIFVAHAGVGIWVVDQYKASGTVRFRHMEVPRVHAQRPDRTWPTPSRNPLAFAVIEL